MNGQEISFDRLRAAVLACAHEFFEQGDYNLNLIGVRTNDNKANKFNDYLSALFFVNDQPQCLSFPITTDPGLYYRRNPANVRGTAIVKPGQYKGLWQLGKHQGKYLALVQTGPVTVYRDNDKDDELDEAETQTGLFGINCHRANEKTTSHQVDRWSAGCQVIANPQDFHLLIALCQRAAQTYGDRFTYTLLQEGDL